MEYLSADKILVIDLGSSDAVEEELDEELVPEKIGGAAITKYLYEQHADGDPIVIGTGLLTGTLFPAAASGIITAKCPTTGKVAHCPVTFKLGLEIQYAGFDYIVIKGRSPEPVFLWIHDGVADISDASDVWGKDVWETTDTWRQSMGDDLIQTLVIGPAGENGSDFAQLCCNYWASADRFGFGKLFGEKNLKGAAFRGMGLLEIANAEEFVEQCLDVLEDIKEGGVSANMGIGDICAAMGHADVKEWLAPIVHRHSACYNTPVATSTFVFLDEDPGKLEEPDQAEPGHLVTDIFGLIGCKQAGLSAPDAGRLLKACARYGIDAVAVTQLSQAAGYSSLNDIQDALGQLSGSVEVPGNGIFSPWCPMQPIFGQFEEVGSDVAAWWTRRQAVAYIFGIHPIFAVMAPELVEDDLLDAASVGTEIEFSPEILEAAIDYLLK